MGFQAHLPRSITIALELGSALQHALGQEKINIRASGLQWQVTPAYPSKACWALAGRVLVVNAGIRCPEAACSWAVHFWALILEVQLLFSVLQALAADIASYFALCEVGRMALRARYQTINLHLYLYLSPPSTCRRTAVCLQWHSSSCYLLLPWTLGQRMWKVHGYLG